MGDVPRVLLEAGENFIVVADMDGTLDGAGEAKATEGLNDRPELGLVVAAEQKGFKVGGSGHEPDGHAGDDAEVRLGEEAIEKGADTPTIERPGDGMGKPTIAGFDDVTGWQNDFEPAGLREMVAVRGVAEAAFHGVADEAGIG